MEHRHERARRRTSRHDDFVRCVAISEKCIVTSADNGILRVYENGEGYAPRRVTKALHTVSVRQIFFGGADILITAFLDETVVFTSLSAGVVLARLNTGIMTRSMAITPDVRLVCGGLAAQAAIMSPPACVADEVR